MIAHVQGFTGRIRLISGVLLASWGLTCFAQSQNFCSFSTEHGWSANKRSDYIVRRAGPQDTSGIPQVIAKINSALGINPAIDIYIALTKIMLMRPWQAVGGLSLSMSISSKTSIVLRAVNGEPFR